MRASLLIALLTVGSLSAWAEETPPPPATTSPANTPATTRATSRPADPLATPDSAVLRLFELLGKNDVAGVRAMLTEPPEMERLREYVAGVSWKLKKGAKVELVETKIQRSAAVVLYRTTYPKGRVEVSPVILIGRYERWKVVFGQANPRRYTTAEKDDLVALGDWMQQRLKALNPPATQPAQPAPAVE